MNTTLARSLTALTTAETRALVIALHNGAPVSFDLAAHPLQSLRTILTQWCGSGAVPVDTVISLSAGIVAQRAPVPTFAPAPAFAPAAPAAPAFEPLPVYTVTEEPAALAAKAEAFEPLTPAVVPQARIDGAIVRRPAREIFADLPGATLSTLPAGMMLDYYASPLAPAVDPFYTFDAANLNMALVALAATPSMHCWLGGPRGTGKTEFTHQLAARLGRPFFRVNFNRATEASDILGGLGIVTGNTQFVPGPVADAIETAGAILLLDELTYGTAGHIASLNPVLERTGAPVRLPMTGRKLNRAPGVMVFVADNTFGHGGGAETMGRTPMASDTLDRIGYFLRFDYLPADVEARVLRAIVERDCGIKPTATMARDVCRVMRVAREKADAGDLQGAPSLRRAAAFCVALIAGIRPADAYAAAVVYAAPEDSQEALRQIFAAHWPHKPEDGFTSPAAPTFGDASTEGAI